MAKLTRVFQNIFGVNATTGEIKQFGSLAAGSPLTTVDPAIIQALSNFTDGWFAAVLGNNSPAIEDVNALFFLAYRQLAYLFQAGVAEYNATTVYYIGSVCSSGGALYVSRTDANTGNALTSATNWEAIGGGLQRAVAGDTTLLATDRVLEIDATGATSTVTLPAASTMRGKQATVVKTDATANPVVLGSLTQKLLAQGDAMTIYSNGTSWYQI